MPHLWAIILAVAGLGWAVGNIIRTPSGKQVKREQRRREEQRHDTRSLSTGR